MTQLQRLIVCILVVRNHENERQLLLQRRNKKNDDTPYTGYLELPQGKVEAHESITVAAQRELAEETGLALAAITYGREAHTESGPHFDLYTIRPLICATERIQGHFAIALIAQVTGTVSATKEADKHAWYLDSEVKDALTKNIVFPLNRPILNAYLELTPEAAEINGPTPDRKKSD